jgi:biotin carboxyl carrier protein
MEFKYLIGEENHTVKCDIRKDSCLAEIGGEKLSVEYRHLGPNCLSLLQNGKNLLVYFAHTKDTIHIYLEGEKYVLKIAGSVAEYAGGAAGVLGAKGLVATPMPGTIIKFLVKEGDIVEVDQGLVIVEAMKMENEIRSTIRARVKKLNFQPKDAVDVGQAIIDLEEIKE